MAAKNCPLTPLGPELEDYTRAVYTRLPRLKLETADAFKSFRAAADNESGSRLRAVMTANTRELSMGEVRDICEQDGIAPHTTVLYHPASNWVAERTIGVYTNAAPAMPIQLRSPGFSVDRGLQHSDLGTQQGAFEGVGWTYPVRGSLWCEARPCALARVWGAMRCCHVPCRP